MTIYYCNESGADTTDGLTELTAFRTVGRLSAAVSVGNHEGYVQSGNYPLTSSTPNANGGPIQLGNALVQRISGYETTIRDECPNNDRPLITENGAAPSYLAQVTNNTNGGGSFLSSLVLDSESTSARCLDRSASTCHRTNNTFNMVFRNSTNTNARGTRFFSCLSENAGNHGFEDGTFVYCTSRNANNNGFHGGSGEKHSLHCLSDRAGGVGYSNATRYASIHNCVDYNSTSHGVDDDDAIRIVNHISWGAGGYAFNTRADTVVMYSAAGSFTSGRTNIAPIVDFSGITLNSNPFVDPDNANPDLRDFSLNDLADGGALCRAAGMTSFGQQSVKNQDLGPIQTFISGGGGGDIVNPFGVAELIV